MKFITDVYGNKYRVDLTALIYIEAIPIEALGADIIDKLSELPEEFRFISNITLGGGKQFLVVGTPEQVEYKLKTAK